MGESKEKMTIELWSKGKHGREEKPMTRRKVDDRTKIKNLARWAISRLEREGLSIKDIIAIDPDQCRIYVNHKGSLVPYWDERARYGDSNKSVSGIGKRRLEALLVEYPDIKDARKLTQEEWFSAEVMRSRSKPLAEREGYKRMLEHIFR
jgi:hypothetical protein